jgi:broad specificity polyphosphatase/5'/3'-nucleotidase SurE
MTLAQTGSLKPLNICQWYIWHIDIKNRIVADNGVGTDFHAIANNYVSVTPLQIDLTKYNEIDTVSIWLETIK